MKHSVLYFIGICIPLCAYGIDEDFDVDYVAKRLDQHIRMLSQFNKKNKYLQIIVTPRALIDVCSHAHIYYTHGLTQLCAKKMITEKSLDPLFEAWDLFTRSFKSVDPRVFLRECAILLFAIYKNLLFEMAHIKPLNIDIDKIIELYEKIQTLPIGKVLDALDECYERFVEIMKEYGMLTAISWSEWFSVHWWVPPVAIGSIFYTLLQRDYFKNKVYEGSMYIRQYIKNSL